MVSAPGLLLQCLQALLSQAFTQSRISILLSALHCRGRLRAVVSPFYPALNPCIHIPSHLSGRFHRNLHRHKKRHTALSAQPSRKPSHRRFQNFPFRIFRNFVPKTGLPRPGRVPSIILSPLYPAKVLPFWRSCQHFFRGFFPLKFQRLQRFVRNFQLTGFGGHGTMMVSSGMRQSEQRKTHSAKHMTQHATRHAGQSKQDLLESYCIRVIDLKHLDST